MLSNTLCMRQKNLVMMQAQKAFVSRPTGKVIRKEFLLYKRSKNNHGLGRKYNHVWIEKYAL